VRNGNLIAAAALSSVLALAARGGGSGPSKSQFVAKSDAICKATQAQTTPLILWGAVIRVGSQAAVR
jgi:hypothetical protein